MRRLLASLLLLLASPAFAALTVPQNANVAEANPSVAFGSSVAAGTVIIATTQNDSNPCTSETLSDTVNSGHYALLSSSSDNDPCVFWMIANATGTPTVSVVGSDGGTIVLSIAQVTGWAGTPTADTSVTQAWSATSATLTVSPLVSAQNNEIYFAVSQYYGGAAGTGTSSGWTVISSAPNAPYWNSGSPGYAFEATAGTSIPLSATISSSQLWNLSLAGIYDNTGPAPSVNNAVMPARRLAIGFGYSSGGAGLALNGSPAPPAIGSLYAASLIPSGGAGGYACSQVSVTPNTGQWLSILPNCTLQGIAQDSAPESVTAQVTDSAGTTATHSFTITPATTGSLSVLTSASLTGCSKNGACFYHVLLKGGSPPYNCNNAPWTQPFVVTPDQWIELTPTSTGSQAIGSTTCFDSAGTSATFSPSVTVDSTLRFGAVDPDTGYVNCPPARKGDYWQCQLILYAGSGTGYTYSVTAGLPAWASITAGLISGTPTASGNVVMTAHGVDSSSDTANASVLVNVGSSASVSRPTWNSSTGNGFFVLGTQLYDPNGHLFQIAGMDRNHYDSTSWASDTNGALSGANAVREFSSFGEFSQSASTIASHLSTEYIANGIVPIVTISTVQSSFTVSSVSGTSMVVSAVNTTASTSNAGVIVQGEQIQSGLTGCPGGVYIASGPSNGLTGTYTLSASGCSGSGTVVAAGGTSGNTDPNAVIGGANMLASAESALASIQADLILNIANEWGSTESVWQSAYATAISTLRTAGYTDPLMIDLPSEGEDFTVLTNGDAAALIADDSLKNVLFSAHLYNTSATLGQITNITTGANAVITFNSAASVNPFTLLTNFPNQVYVNGVTGSIGSSVNGQLLSSGGSRFGGSAGAWTLITSATTTGSYSSGGTVYDGYYYQVRVNQLVASGLPVFVGEFGPPGEPATCGSTAIDNQSVPISTMVAAIRNSGLIGYNYWAWDDQFFGSVWNCGFNMTDPPGFSFTNGQYLPTEPWSLNAPGIDIINNPATGLMSGQPPATVLH